MKKSLASFFDRLPFSLRRASILVFGALFAVYVLFQARFIAFGPGIVINSHRDGEVVATSTLTLSGTVRNAAWLSLNGRQIYTDESGFWSEKLILSEGVSIMTVNVRDRFGREKSTSVSLVLN